MYTYTYAWEELENSNVKFNPNKLRECCAQKQDEKLAYAVKNKSLNKIISRGMNRVANI